MPTYIIFILIMRPLGGVGTRECCLYDPILVDSVSLKKTCDDTVTSSQPPIGLTGLRIAGRPELNFPCYTWSYRTQPKTESSYEQTTPILRPIQGSLCPCVPISQDCDNGTGNKLAFVVSSLSSSHVN